VEEEMMRRRLQVLVGIVAAGAVAGGAALAASAPTAVTGGTSAVGQTTAVLHGTVNPSGSATTYYFQWGLTAAYTANSAPQSAGSGTKAIAVRATATPLTPGTTYHYRVSATSQFGTVVGADRTFRTAGHPPAVVTTGPVTDLSASGADLTGTINPSGQATTWYFQWGNLNGLSQQTAPQTLRAGSAPQSVAWSLQGLLNAGTIYQYRLVAVHQGSAATDGTSALFMTYPSQRPYARVSAATRPRHRHRRPYVFTTRGSISPAWIPAQYGCAGEVAVRFFDGNRRVRQTLAPVQANCIFSTTTTFRRRPGGKSANPPVRLSVVVRFLSNAYLAPTSARLEHVTVG
jgi:hypothetical protein